MALILRLSKASAPSLVACRAEPDEHGRSYPFGDLDDDPHDLALLSAMSFGDYQPEVWVSLSRSSFLRRHFLMSGWKNHDRISPRMSTLTGYAC